MKASGARYFQQKFTIWSMRILANIVRKSDNTHIMHITFTTNNKNPSTGGKDSPNGKNTAAIRLEPTIASISMPNLKRPRSFPLYSVNVPATICQNYRIQ